MKVSNSKERLFELMNTYKLNQTEFCKKTGIQKSALSNYLNGDRVPRQDQLSLIADAFNVDPAWLMGYDVPMYLRPLMKAYERGDFARSITDNEIDILKKLRALEATYSPEQIERGLEFISLYQNAIPEIQAAVDSLLKSQKQNP